MAPALLSGVAFAKGRHHKAWGKPAAAVSKKTEAPAAPAAAPATAAPSCGGAWKMATDRQKAGHLTEARDLFAACRQATCLPAVRKECAKQYDQLEADIPSVVAVVTDSAGEPRTDVEIKVDGHVLAAQLDGRSVPVDPGVHEFSFSNEAGVFSTQKIMVAEGQHHRLISASVPGAGGGGGSKKPTALAAKRQAAAPAPAPIAAAMIAAKDKDPAPAAADQKDDDSDKDKDDDSEPTASKPETTSRHVPVTSWVLGGVGLAGIGGYGLLTYWGRKDNTMLGQCSPMCDQSSTDHVHRMYLGADVSLGVGIASLAASYLVYRMSNRSSSSQTEEAATQQAYLFDVQTTHAGAVASVSGTF